MEQLNRVIKTIVQRTSSNTGKLRTEEERAAFSNNVRADIANILDQLNSVYYPLLSTLMSEQQLNALDYGLSGNVIKTHINANQASATSYWDSTLSRARTLKETIDVVLSEISRLENTINQVSQGLEYDDTELVQDITELQVNLDQVVLDTFGSNYVLGDDGNANLTYSLAQGLDAIGAFFTSWPGTGNTYSSAFPTLALQVYLSQINLDTHLPQATTFRLVEDLGNIRSFIGMNGHAGVPTYSTYGAVHAISDGDSLELAVWELDNHMDSLLPAFTNRAVLFGDASKTPSTDVNNFAYNSTSHRLGIGTSNPETELDVRGHIQHQSGVVSRGGNTRGAGASDFQTIRSAVTQIASGSDSFLAGGQNNTASGNQSFASNRDNLASGDQSFAIGSHTEASGQRSFSANNTTVASGDDSACFGQNSNTIGAYSFATGRQSRASLDGERALASGAFTQAGDAQVSDVVVRNITINAISADLYLDGSAATQKVILRDNTSYAVSITVIGRDTLGNTCHYILEATFGRLLGPPSTTLIGAITKRTIVEQLAACDATCSADTTAGGITVTVTGDAGAEIRWVAHIKSVAVGF